MLALRKYSVTDLLLGVVMLYAPAEPPTWLVKQPSDATPCTVIVTGSKVLFAMPLR
jgi:hypothetical protein